MTTLSKTIFITGASTGFGRAITERAAEAGHNVIATARRPEGLSDLAEAYPQSVLALRLDVTSQVEAKQAVKDTLARFGRIDVLINNAGYGLMGALEELSDADIRRQIDTNLVGLIDVTRAVLPAMREQGAGRIVNIGSIAGLVGLPGVSLYNATKFAVAGLSEALAKETEPLGIRVTAVEPGAFRTDFNGRSLSVPERRIEAYATTAGERVAWLQDVDGHQPGDPDKAAAAILDLIGRDDPPKHLVLGEDAYGMVQEKLEDFTRELEANRAVTVATALEEETAA